MGLLGRALTALGLKAAEGEYREGPYHLPITKGWLSGEAGSYVNWWQMGYSPVPYGQCSAMVQACVSAYAQTAAMCPGSHWRTAANGSRERVTNSALSRVMKKPNAYQTPSDFILNLVSLLERNGNAYALAVRNDRYEITELHLMHSAQCTARVASTGEIFYWLAGNDVIERQIDLSSGLNPLHGVPSRDVLHVRLETLRSPLVGETPLTANMLDLATSNAMARQAIAFYDRQSRPSGILSTDATLTVEQRDQLRASWDKQASGLNAGGVPILSNGLKWHPMGAPSKDSQFAEVMKMTDQNIALAFRVPLQILGVGDTPFASTEALMGSWLASGLGFVLNHVEQAFDRLFGLAGLPAEYTELDTSVLLRSDFEKRVTGWAAGVKAGIFATNDARADFELAPAKHGDEPRVQQQDVPLSYWAEQPATQTEAPTPPDQSIEEQARLHAEDLYVRSASLH